MRESAKLAATLVCCVLWAGCPPTSDSPPERNVVLFLFDPTVLEAGQERELNAWIESTRHFYSSLPMNSAAAIFLLNATHPVQKKSYQFNGSIDAHDQYGSTLENDFNEIVPRIKEAWSTAHSIERQATPESCLISALDSIMRYKPSLGEGQFTIVLISDMVESCAEPNEEINLERSEADIERLRSVDLDLKGISRLIVIEMPSATFRNRHDHDALGASWRAAFVRAGIKPNFLYYASEFPDGGFQMAIETLAAPK